MSGMLCKISRKGFGLIGSSERAGLGRGDVFTMTVRHKGLLAPSMTQVDLAIDY